MLKQAARRRDLNAKQTGGRDSDYAKGQTGRVAPHCATPWYPELHFTQPTIMVTSSERLAMPTNLRSSQSRFWAITSG